MLNPLNLDLEGNMTRFGVLLSLCFASIAQAQGSFTIAVDPSTTSAIAYDGYALYAQYSVVITAADGFAGTIHLSITSDPLLPSDGTVTYRFDYPVLSCSGVVNDPCLQFLPGDTSKRTTLLVQANENAVGGSYTLTIIGTSDGTSQESSDLDLKVQETFTVTSDPASATIKRRGSATYTFQVDPRLGFSGNLYFQLFGLPKGASATFNPQTVTVSYPDGGSPVNASTTLTVTVKGSTPAGIYNLVASPYLWTQQVPVTLKVE